MIKTFLEYLFDLRRAELRKIQVLDDAIEKMQSLEEIAKEAGTELSPQEVYRLFVEGLRKLMPRTPRPETSEKEGGPPYNTKTGA